MAQELPIYDLAISKRSFITNESADSPTSIQFKASETSNLVEEPPIEIYKSNQGMMDNSDESYNIDKIQLAIAGTTSTLGVFSPLITKVEQGGIWVRPYATFENIPLKNGPTVNNTMYGSLIGIDSDLKYCKHNFQVVYTGYAAYTGAKQTFNRVKHIQNSGFGGLNLTLYKSNFFSSNAVNIGGSNINSNDSKDIVSINTGVVSRTGYNLKLPHHLVFQPNYIMSYTYSKTFNYRDNRGALVRVDPLHTIQIDPSFRLYANLKDGWQPYIMVNLYFNLIGVENVSVDNVSIPSASIGTFVEYGGGVQKSWDKKYSGFIQALVRQGGRNGIALLAGFRWATGK